MSPAWCVQTISKLKLCEERLEELDSELKELEPQRRRVYDFEELRKKSRARKEAAEDRDQLEDLVTTARGYLPKPYRERVESAEAAFSSMVTATRLRSRAEDLDLLINDIGSLRSESRDPLNFQPVEELYEGFQKLRSVMVQLEHLIDDAGVEEHNLAAAKERLEKADKRFHEQTDNVVCPLCGKN